MDTDIISRQELEKYNPTLVHRSISTTQADIYRIEIDGKKMALKDYTNRPWLTRHTVARFILMRETKALQRLKNVKGIPVFYGRLKNSILMEYIDGQTFDKTSTVTPQCLHDLQQIITEMHACGVCHNDIRRRNILRSKNDIIYLVDFASAIFHCHQPSILNKITPFKLLCYLDKVKVLRLKKYYFHRQITASDRVMMRKAWPITLPHRLLRKVFHGIISMIRIFGKMTRLRKT